jgi:heme/copper-type cytochrome/quinol oxidase subunit 2
MNTLIWICATLAIVIFGVMLHSVATFRSDTTRLRRHAIIEVAWALVPILIVIAAAMPSLNLSSNGSVISIAATD